MNNKIVALSIAIVIIGSLFIAGPGRAETEYVTMYYGDISLDGYWHWMPGTWDITCDELLIEYTLDLSGAPNVAYNWDWTRIGHVGLVHPADSSGAWLGGYLSDWANRFDEFPSYPDFDNVQDIFPCLKKTTYARGSSNMQTF